MRVGVTGASGFIGKHLVERLKKDGIEFVVFEGDLLSKNDVATFLKQSPTAIVHLAGAAAGSDFDELIRRNVIPTFNLLTAAGELGVKKIIHVSSVAVYGPPSSGYSREIDQLFPDSPYGLSKLIAEQVAQFCARQFNFELTMLRFSAVYGPGNDKGVVYQFLSGIKERKMITVNGDGNQKRNFLHVRDAVGAIVKALNSSPGIYNIASPKAISVNDLVAAFKKQYEFEVTNTPANPVPDLVVSTNLAQKELGFTATAVDLELY